MIFENLFQKVIVGFLKAKAKSFIELAIEKAKARNIPADVDFITNQACNIIKARFGITVPKTVDAAVDSFLAPVVVKLRDLAVAKAEELESKI